MAPASQPGGCVGSPGFMPSGPIVAVSRLASVCLPVKPAPLVAAFGEGLQTQRHKISAKSRPGEKLTCIHNHRAGLQTFLLVNRVEIDSNRVENLIRPSPSIAGMPASPVTAKAVAHGAASHRSSRPARAAASSPSPVSARPPKLSQTATRKAAPTTCCHGTSSRQAKPTGMPCDRLHTNRHRIR